MIYSCKIFFCSDSSVTQSCPTLCDAMDSSMPGFPVHHQFPELAQMNIQDWFPLGLTGLIFLQSKGLSRYFSNTTVQKHQFFGAQLSLWSSSHIHTWLLEKITALTRRTFVSKIMVFKEIKPVNPKGNQSWIFTGRPDAEAETPILWPPEAKADSLEKTLMLGKIEGGRRRGWQRVR